MKRIRKTTLKILIMTMFVSLLEVNHIYAEHSHDGYTKVTQENVSVLNSAGNYYLDGNISTDTITINGTVNLCLNGKTITFNGTTQSETKGSVFYVGTGSTLNLYDCASTGKITGGKGINQSANRLGAGVYVNGGTFNMYGGTISENGEDGTYYSYGAGVEVRNDGTFNMHGGSITSNVIGFGSGAGVNVELDGVFNMYGGSISNNTAAEKASGVSILLDGVFNMYGGSITGNTISNSTGVGGGVYVQQDESFYVCSDPSTSVITITGNTSNGSTRNDNVFLADGSKIYLTRKLDTSSRIGVRMPEPAQSTTAPGFFTNNYDGNAKTSNFSSDDSKYIVTTGNDSGNVEARLDFPSTHTHDFEYSASGPTLTATCKNPDCTLTDSKISVTLQSGSEEYDGKPHIVTIDNLTNFNNETGLSISADNVNYFKGTTPLEDAPIDVDNYTAKLTTYNVTAILDFKITPREVTLDWKDKSFTYDGKKHCPTATAGGLVSGDTCTVTVAGAQSAVGTHTAEATALSNSNYKLPSDKTVKFTISEKTAPTPEPDKDKESDQKKSSTYVAPRTGIE